MTVAVWRAERRRDFALRARAGCAGKNATVIDRRYIFKNAIRA